MSDTPTTPGTTQSAPAFMDRLEHMRRRARRLLVTHGLLALLCWALALFLGLCALDYAFWFPGALRLAFAAGWIVLISWMVTRQVLPAVIARFRLLDVATKIEQRFPEFQDRLTSSVSFISEPADYADPLREKLIERTERIAASLPLEQAISTRPIWRMVWLTVMPAILLAATATLRPGLLHTGFMRYAAPLGSIEWPKRVHISPLTGDVTIAIGESLVLAMEVSKGQEPALRGFLNIKPGRGPVERITMRREGSNRYAATMQAVTDSFTYWFEAGDDDTRRKRSRVRVVDRPEVQALKLIVQPPSYVEAQSALALPRGQRFVEVVEGSSITLSFRSSKPLGREGDQPLATVQGAETTQHAAETAPGSGEFSVTLSPQTAQTYAIHLVDTDGFESAGADTVAVELIADAAPRVRLLDPSQALEVTVDAIVPVLGAAEDDLGVGHIALSAEVAGRGTVHDIPIADWQPILDDRGRVTTEFSFDWKLADLHLAVGDEVRYQLRVQDNRNTAEIGAQEGRSYEQILKVVSPQTLAASTSQELNRLAQKLRGFSSRQEQLLQRAENVYGEIQDGTIHDADAALLGQSAAQRSLAQQLGRIRKKAEALSEQLRQNHIVDTPENHQTERFSETLRSVIEPTMQQAAVRLNNARGQEDSAGQLADLSEAQALQHKAGRAIEDLLKELSVWDDYNSVMAHLRRLIDLQQEVSQQTALLQERTLGQTVEDLPKELRQELQRGGSAQDRISTTLEQALEKLEALQAKLQSTRPDEAKALAEARRRLSGQQAAELSRKAADAIRRNQTGQAQAQQNRVERALSDTVSHLENKRTRQLAELTKKLAELEKLVQSILEEQRALHGETAAVEDTTTLPDLAPRQTAVRRNTAAAAAQLDTLDNAGSAAELAHVAATHMAEAIDALYEERGLDATAAQGLAIGLLERVLKLLEERREQTEEQLQLQNLLATRRALQGLRRKQSRINEATEDIVSAIRAAGRRTRKDVRRAKKQARVQNDVIEETVPLLEKLESAPVYLWVLERIRTAMTASRDQLRTPQLEEPLLQDQARALGLIDQLIDAINQAQQMAEDQFAGGGGGGGGTSSGSGQGRPVPAVAELLVLKAVQQDIRNRTTDLATTIEPDAPTEAQLQTARELGREQSELKALTIQLTQQARQP